MAAAESRLDIDGSIADLFQPSATDAKVRLAGPSLSKLQPFMRRQRAESDRPAALRRAR